MAKEIKFTKEQVLNISLDLVREKGVEGLNARSIAKMMGSSTQPIYSCFKNMNELKSELYLLAQKLHKAQVLEYMEKVMPCNYMAYGMGFVKFAKEENKLFQFLFLQDLNESESKVEQKYIEEVITQIVNDYAITREQAKQFHNYMSIFALGLAVLQNRGANFSDEIVQELFKNEFIALSKVYLQGNVKVEENNKKMEHKYE